MSQACAPAPGGDAGPPAAGQHLPTLYLITPQPGESDALFLRELDAALRARSGPPPLVQLRAHGLAVARWQALAREALQLCRGHGARLLLGAGALARWDADRLLGLGADGLHLPSRLLDRALELPRPPGLLLGASCHDAGL
ncbi:MAG: thiamine phosphate synthase, partial [Betaproteobacteria bacterium]|nr:thiamine phosphate synthase [Betaproteobacteria bacterium]